MHLSFSIVECSPKTKFSPITVPKTFLTTIAALEQYCWAATNQRSRRRLLLCFYHWANIFASELPWSSQLLNACYHLENVGIGDCSVIFLATYQLPQKRRNDWVHRRVHQYYFGSRYMDIFLITVSRHGHNWKYWEADILFWIIVQKKNFWCAHWLFLCRIIIWNGHIMARASLYWVRQEWNKRTCFALRVRIGVSADGNAMETVANWWCIMQIAV